MDSFAEGYRKKSSEIYHKTKKNGALQKSRQSAGIGCHGSDLFHRWGALEKR